MIVHALSPKDIAKGRKQAPLSEVEELRRRIQYHEAKLHEARLQLIQAERAGSARVVRLKPEG